MLKYTQLSFLINSVILFLIFCVFIAWIDHHINHIKILTQITVLLLLHLGNKHPCRRKMQAVIIAIQKRRFLKSSGQVVINSANH